MKFLPSMMRLWTVLLNVIIVIPPSTLAFQGPKQQPMRQQQQRSRGWVKALRVLPHYECATAAVMAGLGDVLAQVQRQRTLQRPTSTTNRFVWNRKRTFHFMIKGLGEGFLWTLWYRNAERWSLALTRSLLSGTGTVSPGWITTLVGTVVSLLLDLTLACPVIYGLWDIPVPALLRGTPIRQLGPVIRDRLGDMLAASVKVWTPVNVLIYNVPVPYRVYIMSCADVFWQMIVSSITTTTTDDAESVAAKTSAQAA